MDRAYVEELHIENYGCIKDATFKLTPLHALIGPNDSGKSTVLRAIRMLAPGRATADEREQIWRAIDGSTGKLKLSAKTALWEWRIIRRFNTIDKTYELDGSIVDSHGDSTHKSKSARPQLITLPLAVGSYSHLSRALRGSLLLRLDPDALRIPNRLIPQKQPLRFMDERGTGLAAIYDGLMVRNINAYLSLNESLLDLFPYVKSISLVNATDSTKAMGVKLADETYVPAELMSEGLLYYLAYAALPHIDPTSILLIEEPENGLHPARIAEVMRVLRGISEKTQVIIATHSPLVINELQPDEVTVVTRTRKHGTKGVLMKDTPNFEERSKVYALGELWVSYANGVDEGPLLKGGPRS